MVITRDVYPVKVRYYLFEDFIIRQNILESSAQGSLVDIEYAMLEISSDTVHEVPPGFEHRSTRKYAPKHLTYSLGKKEILRKEVEDVCLGEYRCKKVTEVVKSHTPFGSIDSGAVRYFADLTELFIKYTAAVYSFLGFSESCDDRFKWLIRRDYVDEDNKVWNVLMVTIEDQWVDPSLIDRILSLPCCKGA